MHLHTYVNVVLGLYTVEYELSTSVASYIAADFQDILKEYMKYIQLFTLLSE